MSKLSKTIYNHVHEVDSELTGLVKNEKKDEDKREREEKKNVFLRMSHKSVPYR